VPWPRLDVAPLVAVPLVRVTGVPKFAPSTVNCTVPVGVPALLVTVAVNVTDCPTVEGFTDDVTAVVVVTGFTVCVSTGEVLVA
jgi:hypothetical protein